MGANHCPSLPTRKLCVSHGVSDLSQNKKLHLLIAQCTRRSQKTACQPCANARVFLQHSFPLGTCVFSPFGLIFLTSHHSHQHHHFHNPRICFFQAIRCQCAFAHCESAVAAGVLYSQVSAPSFKREIHRELASCSRRCNEIREFLNTE